jgi:hypothetical protein
MKYLYRIKSHRLRGGQTIPETVGQTYLKNSHVAAKDSMCMIEDREIKWSVTTPTTGKITVKMGGYE